MIRYLNTLLISLISILQRWKNKKNPLYFQTSLAWSEHLNLLWSKLYLRHHPHPHSNLCDFHLLFSRTVELVFRIHQICRMQHHFLVISWILHQAYLEAFFKHQWLNQSESIRDRNICLYLEESCIFWMNQGSNSQSMSNYILIYSNQIFINFLTLTFNFSWHNCNEMLLDLLNWKRVASILIFLQAFWFFFLNVPLL